MKRIFITVLAFALIAATCLAMTSCNAIPFLEDMLGNSNKVEGPNDNNQGLVGEYVAFDFTGSIANIGDATSIGVTSKVMETEGDAFKIYCNTILSMTTVDGADKLFDVTFTKIETEGATEEITGTRRAMPNNGEILIAATEGFTYAIYGSGVKMCDGIVDNGVGDLDPKVGVIAVGGFTDGEVYDVEYAGIGKETVMDQSKGGFGVNTLYVLGDYTYISVSPRMFYKFDSYDGVINNGSVTNGVIKDIYIANGNFNGSYVVNGTSGTVINGVYVGDAPIVNIGSMHQGYLIDNFTGYVYACDAKLEFKNGFVVKEGKYYDFAIDSDGKLSLDLVVRNESLHIYNIFKDKYGNKYVQNDYLDAYDADNRTVYYTKTNYFLAKDGTAIHIDYTGQFNYSEMPSSFTVLERMNADFTASPISAAEDYEIDFSPCNGNSSHDASSVVISHIADGYLYMYSTQSGAYTYYLRVRTDDLKSESTSYGMYGYDGGNWTYNCLKSAPIDADTVLWWTDWSGTPTLYYGDVWGNNAMSYSREMDGTFTITNENVLLQNCKCVPDWEFDFKNIKFAYTTVEKTVFYMIVIDENGTPRVVDSENYKDDAKNTTVFQTIER